MGECLLVRRAGGAKVNGVVRQYPVKAGQNIAKGDMVALPFVVSPYSRLTIEAAYQVRSTGAFYSNNRYLYLLNFEDTVNRKNKLYAKIINADTNTVINTTYLIDTEFNAEPSVPFILGTNKVLIVVLGDDKYPYAIILTLDNDQINISTPLKILGSPYSTTSFNAPCLLALSPNKVICLLSTQNPAYALPIISVILTVSGNSVTASSSTNLPSTRLPVKACLISSNRIITARYTGISDDNVAYMLLGITNESVSVLASISAQNKATYYDIVGFSVSNVICFFGIGYALQIVSLSIQNDTITIKETLNSGSITNLAAVSPLTEYFNKERHQVLLAVPNENNLSVRIYDFTKNIRTYEQFDIIGVDSTTAFSSQRISFNGSKLALSYYESGSSAKGTFYIQADLKRLAEKAADIPIGGVAKSAGTGGQTIEVYTV